MNKKITEEQKKILKPEWDKMKNFIKDTDKKLNKAAQELGSRGGKKTAEKGKKYMSEIGKAGAIKRWGNKKAEKIS